MDDGRLGQLSSRKSWLILQTPIGLQPCQTSNYHGKYKCSSYLTLRTLIFDPLKSITAIFLLLNVTYAHFHLSCHVTRTIMKRSQDEFQNKTHTFEQVTTFKYFLILVQVVVLIQRVSYDLQMSQLFWRQRTWIVSSWEEARIPTPSRWLQSQQSPPMYQIRGKHCFCCAYGCLFKTFLLLLFICH